MKIVFDIRGDNDMFDMTISGYSGSKSLGVEFLRIGYDVSENFVKLEKYCGDRILKVYPSITIFEEEVIRYTLDIVKYHERRKNEIYDLFMKDNDYRKYRDDNVKLDEEIAKACRKDVFNHLGEVMFSDGEIWYFVYYSPIGICISQIQKRKEDVDLDIDWLRYKWNECVCGNSEDVEVVSDKMKLTKGKSCRKCGSLDVERG